MHTILQLKYTMFSLFVFLITVVHLSHAEVCNCTGCDVESAVDSSEWCSCCHTALNPTCITACSSVYNSTQCIVAGYGRTVCTPSNVTYNTPRSISQSATKCNCLLCQYDTLTIGGKDWCRCCNILFSNCEWSYRCDTTVFTQSGCVENGWEDVCFTEQHIVENDDLPPRSTLSSTISTTTTQMSDANRLTPFFIRN